MRPQVGRLWVYKSNAPCFWREFHQNSGHTCCSPEADSGKARKANTPRARKAWTRAKESTRVNTRTVLSFEGYCGHCGKWGHKQKDCRYKNTVAEVDEEESLEPQNSSASSSTTRVTPPPPGLSLVGTAQSTTGSISTLMEVHAQSCWLCELEVGSDDARVRECEFVELLVDTRATEHVCGPHDFTHVALKNGPRPALKTATGELLKHYGTRTVDFRCQGEELRVGFAVVDVKRPILSISRLMDRCIETFIKAGNQFLRRFDGARVELTPRGGLFVLQC